MEGENKPEHEVQQIDKPAKRLKNILAVILLIPFITGFILTELQVYPATIAINLLLNKEGKFPVQAATLLTIILLFIPLLGIITILTALKKSFLLVKKLLHKSSGNGKQRHNKFF